MGLWEVNTKRVQLLPVKNVCPQCAQVLPCLGMCVAGGRISEGGREGLNEDKQVT